MDAYKVDSLMDDFNDVISKIYKPAVAHNEAEKATQTAEIFDKIVPTFLAKIDERCASGEFLVGKNLTIADFYVGGLYTNFCANSSIAFAADQWAAVLEKHPNFKAYGERYVAATQKWQSERPAYPV